jgi:hypothetical protein
MSSRQVHLIIVVYQKSVLFYNASAGDPVIIIFQVNHVEE